MPPSSFDVMAETNRLVVRNVFRFFFRENDSIAVFSDIDAPPSILFCYPKMLMNRVVIDSLKQVSPYGPKGRDLPQDEFRGGRTNAVQPLVQRKAHNAIQQQSMPPFEAIFYFGFEFSPAGNSLHRVGNVIRAIQLVALDHEIGGGDLSHFAELLLVPHQFRIKEQLRGKFIYGGAGGI